MTCFFFLLYLIEFLLLLSIKFSQPELFLWSWSSQTLSLWRGQPSGMVQILNLLLHHIFHDTFSSSRSPSLQNLKKQFWVLKAFLFSKVKSNPISNLLISSLSTPKGCHLKERQKITQRRTKESEIFLLVLLVKPVIYFCKDKRVILAICIARACSGRGRAGRELWGKIVPAVLLLIAHISGKIAMDLNECRERNKELGQVILLTEWRRQNTSDHKQVLVFLKEIKQIHCLWLQLDCKITN